MGGGDAVLLAVCPAWLNLRAWTLLGRREAQPSILPQLVARSLRAFKSCPCPRFHLSVIVSRAVKLACPSDSRSARMADGRSPHFWADWAVSGSGEVSLSSSRHSRHCRAPRVGPRRSLRGSNYSRPLIKSGFTHAAVSANPRRIMQHGL